MASKTDVVIVGAGPSGLFMAIELARQGVNFRIVDQRGSASDFSKGSVLCARAVEALYDLDVLDNLSKFSKISQFYNIYINDKSQEKLYFRDIQNSPFPYTLTLEHGVLEGVLESKLEELGKKVEWGVSFKGMKEERDQVMVKLGNEEVIQAKWLVACDGESSIIRRLSKISTFTADQSDTYVVADARIKWDLDEDECYAFLHKDAVVTINNSISKNKRIQYHFIGDYNRDNVNISEAKFQDKLSEILPCYIQLEKIDHLACYQHQRFYARNFIKGRVILVGDAAHSHAPIAGHSINNAILDAHNLGWKLAMDVKGLVEKKVIYTYEEERKAVAERIHNRTNAAFTTLMSSESWFTRMKTSLSIILPTRPAIESMLTEILWDPPARYDNNQLVWEHQDHKVRLREMKDKWLYGSLNAGDFCMDGNLLTPGAYEKTRIFDLIKGTGHHILLFVGDNPSVTGQCLQFADYINKELSDFATCHVLVGEHSVDYNTLDQGASNVYFDTDGLSHRNYGCAEPTIFVIRPDGCIGYSKSPPDTNELFQYLSDSYIDCHRKQVQKAKAG